MRQNAVYITVWCIASSMTIAGALLCYQCVDSTGDREKGGGCQYSVRALAKQRSNFEQKNAAFSKQTNLKNCSNYIDRDGREIMPFCKIEKYSSYGEINGYIRDCSNGSDFSVDFRNATHLSYEKRYIRPDNQTGCGYSPTHFANLCVSICDTDFCNGPAAATNNLKYSCFITYLSVAVCMMMKMRHV
ncbi:hypothetical protein DPMN_022401 [Dreissena polymorpha]|uniref:Uncharacterized protein n=1 Tax=Dreissena polymorpha TaxID=45954 RepID=A0A9D4NQH6_DREPO|nr:hypothetical protein DPMN_022401 [Dreissena polymorpha]